MIKKLILNKKRSRAVRCIAAVLGAALAVQMQASVLAEEIAVGTSETAAEVHEVLTEPEADQAGPVSGLDGTEEELPPGVVSPFEGMEFQGHRAKLVNTNIPLYLAQKNPTAETICYFNAAGDYEIREESLQPTQVNKIATAPKLSLENISYNGLPAIRITASGNAAAVQKGTYTYKLVPYDRGRQEELKAVTLKVSVKAVTVYPAMKISASSVTLNSGVKGDYAYVYAQTEGAKIQPLDHTETPAKIGSGLNVELVNENTAKISISDYSAKASALKATLFFYYGPDWNYKVVKKTISVKKTAKQPKVTLTAKSGSRLDIVQRDAYCMQYTPKVANTGFVLKDISVSEADKGDFNRQFLLETERDENGDVRSVTVRLRKDAKVFPASRNYGFTYVLHGSGSDARQIAGTISVRLKTVQSNTAVKNQSKTSLKLSVSGNNPGYVHYMVNTPVFASVSEDSVKENFSTKIPEGAFSTSVKTDACGRLFTIVVKADPSKVTAGKKYILNYNVFPEGGAHMKYAKLKITVSVTE